MRKKYTAVLAFILLLPVLGMVSDISDDYDIDFSDPESVVTGAEEMLVDLDFDSMYYLTESSQREKTLDMIVNAEMDATYLSDMADYVELIIEFEIVRSEIFTNDNEYYSIVNTKWYMKLDNPQSTDTVTYIDTDSDVDEDNFNIVYVDYLLQKFNDDWLIISQRSK